MIRAIIADDEPLGRRAITSLLQHESDILIVGEARNGDETLALVQKEGVDVVFLDINMPGRSGISIAQDLASFHVFVVFVTAHDEFALDAFDHSAVDYVMKPIDKKRFSRTLDRLRVRCGAGANAQSIAPDSDTAAKKTSAIIQLKTGGKSLYLPESEFRFAEAQRNYSRINSMTGEYTFRIGLTQLHDKFETPDVFRVHRAFLVNIKIVRQLLTVGGAGDTALILDCGAEIPVGRTYRTAVVEALSQS